MNDALSKLPLFATDLEIAVAIVGKQHASKWKRDVLPLLEARGLPKVDPLHGGRPVPLIRKWYELYMGLNLSYVKTTLDNGTDRIGQWQDRRQRHKDRLPQLDLDRRCQKILLYMVAHPDARTHPAVPDAGPFTLEKLAAKGAIVAGKKDRDGDIEWQVTEVGREEATRIDWYFNGKSKS